MKQEKQTVTLGDGEETRKVEVKNANIFSYDTGRTIRIMQLGDNEGITMQIFNEDSTGRDTRQEMFLTEESFIALIASATEFINHIDMDTVSLLKKVTNDKAVDFHSYNNKNQIK